MQARAFRGTWIGAMALMSWCAAAAPVTVALRSRVPLPEPVEATIVAWPHAKGGEPLRIAAMLPGETTLDLASAHDWSITVQAEGWWLAEHLVERGSTAGVEMLAWPAGLVRGTVEETASKPVRRVHVRFQPVVADGLPAGQSSCAVVEKAWACVVPAGTYDLRIRPDNAIAEYRWNAAIARLGEYEAGVLRVRPGAAVLGRVALAPGFRGDVGAVAVSLEPEFVRPAATERAEEQRRTLTVPTKPNERGFFHFDGVAPGRYVVRARLRGATEARVAVSVLPDREAELVEPLVLDRPSSLGVTLRPPLAPDGKPWRVQLARVFESGTTDEIATAPASREGRWIRPALPRGDYQVVVMSDDEVRWATEAVSIVDSAEEIDLALPLVEVKGTVTLGGKPLRATLSFGDVPLRSGEDGAFGGIVMAPPEKGWEISITAEQPVVRRTLERIEPRTGDGVARVDLELPSGAIEGSVRDASGLFDFETALITLHPASGETSSQARVPAKEPFSFAGLAAGRYVLRAEAGGELESNWLELELRDGQTLKVDLLLTRKNVVRGRVTSDHGPLPEAQIDAFPLEHRYPSWARRSDAEGRFQIKLPAWSRTVSLAVRAPGHAFRLMRVNVEPESPVVVVMTQLGGRFVAEVPAAAELRDVWLVHAGAAALVAFVPAMAGGKLEEGEPARFTAPFVEPGEYALCLASDAQLPQILAGARPPSCAVGTVAPGGELKLRLAVGG
jgi:hypothetical protein